MNPISSTTRCALIFSARWSADPRRWTLTWNCFTWRAYFTISVLPAASWARGHSRLEGAEAARKFLERQGLSKARSAIVWDGIALHAQAASEFKRAEIALVAEGAGVDVVGAGLADLSSNAKAEVLAAPSAKVQSLVR